MIPLFYDHSSKKSLLTYDKPSETTENGPRSIVKLCKDNGIDTVYGVSDSFSTFIEARKNCRSEGLKFRFGVELWMCDDAKVHDEASLKNEHKIIIFALNSDAYKDLIKIFSAAHASAENFYYKARFDFNQLNPLWTKNLRLALPFFDSAIARNTLGHGVNIIPNFPEAPLLLREQNSQIPYANTVNRALDRYNVAKDHEEITCKTIYYDKYSDFDAYTVYRCIHNRGATFDDPKMSYFCSPTFSFEDYLSLAK